MELLDELWPTEDRPTKLRKARGIGGLSMSKLMQLKEQFEKESEKKGMGAAVYGRDRKPKAKKFKEMKDDGEKKLHPARQGSRACQELSPRSGGRWCQPAGRRYIGTCRWSTLE